MVAVMQNFSFASLLAPLTEAAFFADYHRKQPLHIRGAAAKLAPVMNWETLSQLVSQTGIWTQRALELTYQLKKLPPQEYCTRGLDRDLRDNWLIDADRVKHWLKQGASLVLNDIATLSPALQAVAATLEQAVGGKAQANLYCSWQSHQGFGTHFDTHDVFALHCAGSKLWKIYQCPIPDPIAHPAFKNLPPEYHQKNHGPVSLEVTLQPGDVLYIPRGWYHDALATSEATIHVTYGVTPMIGLDMVTQLFERAVHEPVFRAALAGGNSAALAAQAATLGDRLGQLAREPQFVEHLAKLIDQFHYHRAQITLPDDVTGKH
jgi:bifunctional lysine-specific demethylase and histidyl-hydroxylase MINA